MSTPKRHHFVPQFYLKRFSQGKRYIRCFYKKEQKIIAKASIKGQCAIDNFYGWQDNIEWSLGVIEARAASIFRTIDNNLALPAVASFAWQELLIFIALQSSRTQLSGRESDEMADFYFKILHQHEAEERGIDLTEVRIGSNFPAALPMQIAIQAYPEMNALHGCLLINKSAIPFITSDNPVIYYNSRFSQVDYMGTIGLTSAGLQIFYPISPSLMVMLYDPSSYRRISNSSSKVLRVTDVIQINLLHYLWSGEVVFWDDQSADSLINLTSEYCGKFLPYDRSVHRESEHVELGDEKIGSLLHSWRAHAPIEANFRFVTASGSSTPSGNLIRGIMPEPSSEPSRSYVFAGEARPRPQMRGNELAAAVSTISEAVGTIA